MVILQKNMTLYGELANFMKGEIHTSVNYARYWHGYLVLFRPLFLFFSIVGIRRILFFLFCILWVIMLKLIHQRFGRKIAFVFGLSLLCNRLFFSLLFSRKFAYFSNHDDKFYLVVEKFREGKRF